MARSVAKMSSVLSAKCCTPGPPCCSRYVCICERRLVPCVGSLMGSSTVSLLLASTTLLRPDSEVPTSAAANSANSWKPVAAASAARASAKIGTFPTAWSSRRSPKQRGG